MKTCKKCGNSLPDNAGYCDKCGAKQKVVAKSTGVRSTMCLAGFLLSLISFFWTMSSLLALISIVICNMGIKEVNEQGKDGKGLAKAGIIISIAVIVIKLIFVILTALNIVDLDSVSTSINI